MPPLAEARGSVAHNQTDLRSIEVSTGSIGTGETDLNPCLDRVVEPSISLADIEDCSYFIQYHPELAEKFSKAKSSSVSVSSRTLSIVFSRLLYWSKYSKHRFGGKLYFWKSQEELGIETGISTKQVNRALKVLVDMGLILRDKFHKHFYRQVYFYHIPVSPFTKEVAGGGGGRSTRGTPAETRKTSKRRRRHFLSALGVPTSSKIDKSRGFSPIGTFCLRDTQESHSLIKHSLKSIVERCNFYGINPPKPINP